MWQPLHDISGTLHQPADRNKKADHTHGSLVNALATSLLQANEKKGRH
jgi:hypothetical protein